jgi:hypothetical protein
MRYFISFLLLVVTFFASAQLHNRIIKFNVGVSSEQIDFKNSINGINDTSLHQFEFVSKSPIVTYSHEFLLGNIISFSGKAGFQYFNIYYDNQYYGSPFATLSINPQISVYNYNRFEYYVKLQVGVAYWFNHPELLSGQIARNFPEKATIFTGVTLGGFNYFITNKMGLNLELSLWSPELLTFGVSYRFFKGDKPSIQQMQNL